MRNHWLPIARRNGIVPRIRDERLRIPVKTLLIGIISHAVPTLDMCLQRAAFAAVLSTDVAHRAVPAPYRSFSSARHIFPFAWVKPKFNTLRHR
jgi:hypothetical protein